MSKEKATMGFLVDLDVREAFDEICEKSGKSKVAMISELIMNHRKWMDEDESRRSYYRKGSYHFAVSIREEYYNPLLSYLKDNMPMEFDDLDDVAYWIGEHIEQYSYNHSKQSEPYSQESKMSNDYDDDDVENIDVEISMYVYNRIAHLEKVKANTYESDVAGYIECLLNEVYDDLLYEYDADQYGWNEFEKTPHHKIPVPVMTDKDRKDFCDYVQQETLSRSDWHWFEGLYRKMRYRFENQIKIKKAMIPNENSSA